MNPLRFALRHPVTIVVAMVALVGTGVLALMRMKVDIFPSLNLPVIYVAQPYGGMTPEQMEGLITNYYEYHFLYIGGIHHVESRNIQSTSLMKLYFHPGTDMAQAMAETITQVNRARAFMPNGTVPPFVMRFDTGSVPVGYLVFSSDTPTRTLGEIQDQALFRVRPMFASLPGVSAPPPFGASARAITVNVNPDKLRAHGVSAGKVVMCLDANNTVSPAGTVRIGDQMPLVPFNGMVTDPKELGNIFLKPGVYLRDVAEVKDETDIATSYALVNGRRAIYIPVNKRAEASTLAVVQAVKDNLDKMRNVVDPDIKVSFEFDQSPTVTRTITSLEHEALLGAVLTGLMVLLFLRDWRSVIVVVLNIPLALVGALVALWLCDQTVNLMTLGGLALAVGILVDEATVEVENIHTQMEQGHPVARAVQLGNAETAVPRLLAMLCILAVFIPSFLMEGSLRALFVPLSLAVGFAMVTSYILSSTLVPVLSVWLLRHVVRAGSVSDGLATVAHASGSERHSRYLHFVRFLTAARWLLVPIYLGGAALVIWLGSMLLGREIFPTVDAGQVQLRLRAPPGTRVERTEELTVRMLDEIKEMVGTDNVALSLGLVGLVPTAYPINNIFQWMSGPEDAVIRLALKPGSGIRVAELRTRLRRELPERLGRWLRGRLEAENVSAEEIEERLKGLSVTFEPGDIVNEIMSFGAPTPVEVAVSGQKFADTRAYAAKLRGRLAEIGTLADLQYGQALDYPTLDVKFDRSRVGPSGVSADDIGKTLTAVTSSSRFIVRNYWRAPDSGVGYQVQVQVPIQDMNSLAELKRTLIKPGVASGGRSSSESTTDGVPGPSEEKRTPVLLEDVADVTKGKTVGQYDRYNMRRMISLTGNVEGEDLGRLEGRVRQVLAAMAQDDPPPRGVEVMVRGQLETMRQLFAGLGVGLLLAVAVILLLLTAYFQSLRLALVVLATVPAVVAGVALALLATRTTLNIQSFMGAIMSIGVAVANAILLATFAERSRRTGQTAVEAAVNAARARLRPILMTSCAMIAGMMPIALGLGEGGEQTAPLGRAVVGGLFAATLTTLLVLPGVFALVMGRVSSRSASIDPDDPESANCDAAPVVV